MKSVSVSEASMPGELGGVLSDEELAASLEMDGKDDSVADKSEGLARMSRVLRFSETCTISSCISPVTSSVDSSSFKGCLKALEASGDRGRSALADAADG